MTRWSERADVQRGSDYDRRWQEMEAAGKSVHGEADLISSFSPAAVLDAGCGTGRVAVELANRHVDVVGVDLDPAMLDAAREKAPGISWVTGDLIDVEIPAADGSVRRFDVVAMAGNVMIFVTPGSERDVVANLARHLAPGGRLIAGFQLGSARLPLASYDEHASAAGLDLEHRWSTWDRQPFSDGDYAVSVHRLPLGDPAGRTRPA